ncbi:MAG: AAA family ATPase [Saprospiraceae bacterium]
MGNNNEKVELKLNDEFIQIIKQYAELVKNADVTTKIGPHINFNRYEKFKKVKSWFQSFTDNPNEEQRRNLVSIFTTGSRSGSIDYKIREKYEIAKETEDCLINANQQGGSFVNLIKKINKLQTLNESDLGDVDKYLDKVILELIKIYGFDENDGFDFTDFGRNNYIDQGVFNELLFLLNIKKDKKELENGCYYDALGIINETLDSKFTYKGKKEKQNFVDEIVSLIEGERIREIPKYLLLDQFFNVIDKIKYVELDNIKDNSRDFYIELFSYFNKKSKYFRQNKSLMNIFNKNKNTILHGPPGTGKTYQIMQYLKDYSKDNENENENENIKDYEYIVFHPNYGYEDFIDGVKPTGFTENKQIKLELVNGHFKQFCIDVHKKNLGESDKTNLPKYYFVVDEINRANLSAVFGETLMLLEDSYRYDYLKSPKDNKNNGSLISLKNSTLCMEDKHWFEKIDNKVLFGIPENIYFIGMMNDVDRSIDSFDLALRRRFAWIERGYDENVIMKELGLGKEDNYLAAIKGLNEFLLKSLSSSSFQLGHSYFLKVKNPSDKNAVKELFDNHLKPLIKEYLRTEYSESEIESKEGMLFKAQETFLVPFTNEKLKK